MDEYDIVCPTFLGVFLFSLMRQFCDCVYNRGSYFVYDPGETIPRAEKRQWMIQSFHYNNVASAMLTLFAVQTTEGWPT